ncbi:MAG: DUF1080 domain-containing protein [Phycisphaerales bacterium]|nr:DUF1080 domain-containing protein [Phycisphaerales bacterium]
MTWMVLCLLLLIGQEEGAAEPGTQDDRAVEPAAEPLPPPPRHGIRRAAPLLPPKEGVGASLYTLDAPPAGFDGRARPLLIPERGLNGWRMQDGGEVDWVIDPDGNLHASDRDLFCEYILGDFQLHLEFSMPRRSGGPGSVPASSGVLLHGRYEIELLNSYARPATTDSCGAVKGLVAPTANGSLPAPGWQALDVFFLAPRLEDGVVVRKPRVTALLNGVLILNNVEIDGPTSEAIATDQPETGGMLLQGCREPVIFRNIWIRQP